MNLRIVLATAIGLTCIAGGASAQSAFEGIGDLPGGTFLSTRPYASADGNVIVGKSQASNGFVPFRRVGSTRQPILLESDLPLC